jgi:hypothetical protein
MSHLLLSLDEISTANAGISGFDSSLKPRKKDPHIFKLSKIGKK